MASIDDSIGRKESLLKKWNSHELSFNERDTLLEEIRTLGLYPQIMTINDEWESEAGLYPDIDDPRFAEKLMSKQEFAENKQESIADQMNDGVNPCDPDKEFELTPVQRFVGRFLSPQCPYLSALLYHGVGVGKTCAAITIAENYLRSFPRRSVIIVAPRNIQPGFRRTIFDDEALQIPIEGPNQAKGCTGNTYLKRAGVELERDKNTVVRRISASISSRYTFLGYIQFHRMIEDILKKIPKGLNEDAYKEQRTRLLRREFSGRMVIIDEAHNLRDTPGDKADDDSDNPGGDIELTESQAGKKLTPTLIKLLDAAEGMKLVLLTGTPMYNSYREIIFLLKLLLINDKRATLSERDIFVTDGRFRKAVDGRQGGEELLGAAANAYVSFMRGENPLSFPVRLPPQGITTMSRWVDSAPNGTPIPDDQKNSILRLPFAPVQFEGASMEAYQRISEDAIEAGGVGVGSIDEMVQSGNWLFPGEAGAQIRDAGFDACFEENITGGPSQFTGRDGPPNWLLRDALGTVSPKAKFTLERARKAKGIVFIYSRFIKSGAIPLALALEANGYSPAGDRKMMLTNPPPGDGRQCAMCEKRERKHLGSDHKFVPAKYVIITGRASISPNNPVAIQAARAKTNMDGKEVKIIIGSQVASEGVDFRFVREIYIFDSWFHLNKMEQVLGRGIRTCSHSLLPPEQRNCTTYLLINTFGEGQDTETADMYMYRNALKKAVEVGRVTRVLKKYALDCNLNRDAIIVTGLASQRHIDSQGTVREEVNVNDTPYTNLCDWIETCDYTCAKPVNIDPEHADLSTYDEYAVRWRETELKSAIRKLFEEGEQPEFQIADILDAMSDVPHRAISGLLADIVGNRAFRLRVKGNEGYIVYRNGYFLFQPDYLSDIRIPLSLRVADVPVKQDSFDPSTVQLKRGVQKPEEVIVQQEQVSGAVQEPQQQQQPQQQPRLDTLESYWTAITAWANAINTGTSIKESIPPEVNEAMEARYVKDEKNREESWLIMISWLYDHIQSTDEYTEENKAKYRRTLGETLIEFIWDESLRPNEQIQLIQSGDAISRAAAKEQIVKKGETEAFRFVDPITGIMKYVCGSVSCSDAVVRVFENDPEDPIRTIQANTQTTGQIYGFIVPKAKERRLIFKTSSAPPPPGGKPEKGGECAIISTISYHIQMLKDISNLLVAEGYPRFILTEDILDEKARKKKEKQDAKSSGRLATVTPKIANRTFENAVRACALKNIILRWLTIMQASKGGKRYFYRPIAALKSGHKGTVAKA
jgi:hypothetical protein